MRFNEKRTCLEFLDKGVPSNLFATKPSWELWRIEQMKQDVIRNFKAVSEFCRFGDSVKYITSPFYQAFEKARPKIAEIMETEEVKAHGTFIMQVDKGITKTIFYWVDKRKDEDAFDAIFFSFTKGFDIIAIDFMIQYKRAGDKDEDGVDVNYYLGGAYDEIGVNYKHLTAEWLSLIGFLKYCDVETKVLEPKQKFKDKIGTRYFNEERQTIEILDCTWFTNLVVSGEFWVSGHLRWQPKKKNGEWTKELIWISDFKKEGYTRKAKIRNDGNKTI
jgi:hypothetical protein